MSPARYLAEWGRTYRHHRDYGDGRVVLVDVHRTGACVIVTPEKLATCYRPLAADEDAAPPPPDNELDLEAPPPPACPAQPDRVQRPRAGVDRRLTLGAAAPGQLYVSIPGTSTLRWAPCAVPMDEHSSWSDWVSHLWFVMDSEHPTLFCPTHRIERLQKRPKPQPYQAPPPADPPPAEVASEERLAPYRPGRPAPGRTPWSMDPQGALWNWPRFNERQAVSLHEIYEERAAIMEYDGQLPRAEAEYQAYGALLDQAARHGLL